MAQARRLRPAYEYSRPRLAPAALDSHGRHRRRRAAHHRRRDRHRERSRDAGHPRRSRGLRADPQVPRPSRTAPPRHVAASRALTGRRFRFRRRDGGQHERRSRPEAVIAKQPRGRSQRHRRRRRDHAGPGSMRPRRRVPSSPVDASRQGGPVPSAREVRDVQRAAWAGLSAGWEKWDSVIMDQLGPVGAAIIERLDIAEDHQHLDIAAGTGEPGLSIARLSPKGRVVLTDLVPEMLDIAARRATAQGMLQQVDASARERIRATAIAKVSAFEQDGKVWVPGVARCIAGTKRAPGVARRQLEGRSQNAERRPRRCSRMTPDGSRWQSAGDNVASGSAGRCTLRRLRWLCDRPVSTSQASGRAS